MLLEVQGRWERSPMPAQGHGRATTDPGLLAPVGFRVLNRSTEMPCCYLQQRCLRCFLSADGVWAVPVLTDAKAFYSSYTESGQFLNPFIKMSAVCISRQIKQQWISNKGVFIQDVLKQKEEDGFFWPLACTCPLEHCLFCPDEMALFGLHPPAACISLSVENLVAPQLSASPDRGHSLIILVPSVPGAGCIRRCKKYWNRQEGWVNHSWGINHNWGFSGSVLSCYLHTLSWLVTVIKVQFLLFSVPVGTYKSLRLWALVILFHFPISKMGKSRICKIPKWFTDLFCREILGCLWKAFSRYKLH